MKEGYPMYTNHDKFHAALALAIANNDSHALETALEAYHDAAVAGESWVHRYAIGHGNCKPCNRIKEVKVLNPFTSDTRTWTVEDVKNDIDLRVKAGYMTPAVAEYIGHNWSEDGRTFVGDYANYLRSVEPQPDRISGVYMMFQRDMGEGFCVKIGASDDCAARQSQYFTHNPFAIKGECMPCDNPKEMEKRFHEWFRTMGYENIKTSREWFAIDKGLYRALNKDGFDAIMCQWEE